MRTMTKMLLALALGVVGMTATQACGDGLKDYQCTITYSGEEGGESLEEDQKSFFGLVDANQAVDECSDYAKGNLGDGKNFFTCTCASQ